MLVNIQKQLLRKLIRKNKDLFNYLISLIKEQNI
jgi:hypothetical protein